jgi:hypothetical protein
MRSLKVKIAAFVLALRDISYEEDEKMKSKMTVLGLVVCALVVLGMPASAHKNNTKSEIEFSANPVTAGTMVTITGTVTYLGTAGPGNPSGHSTVPSNGTPVVGDNVKIEELMLAGVGVPCGTPSASFVGIAQGNTDPLGKFSTIFNTTGLGGMTIGFRALHPDSGDQHGNDQSASPCMDLVITSSCPVPGGVEVAADLASGPGTPPAGCCTTWVFRISVTNCTGVNLTNVKVQGGSNGWASFVSATPSTGSASVRFNQRNEVITWTLNLANGATETLDVKIMGCIPSSAPDGQVRFLSGAWSAAYNAGSGPQKSGYSGQVSITVDNSTTCPM